MGRQQTVRKHGDIRKRINSLKSEKFRGRPKYRMDVIFEMVAEEFYLSTDRVILIYYNNKTN